MSILGAMYAAVSGLQGNSNALGIISDNIANANTIGYKETTTNFETLVTQSNGGTGLYSPGGVESSPFYNINQQGVLQATSSSTDLALTGNGFFVVNSSPNGQTGGGASSLTRAGNFTVDSVGNLLNSAGLYLQGQALTPAESLQVANGQLNQLTATSLNSLTTVNVNGIGGTANATANVTLAANLPATDTTVTGARTVTVPVFDSQGIEHDMTLAFARVASSPSTQLFTESNAIAQNDSFKVAIDGTNYTTAPLTQATPTLTDIANSVNGQFNAAGIKVAGGTPVAGDTFTATINGTAYTSPALSAGSLTPAGIVNALNATLTQTSVGLGGTPAIGDTYSVTINGTAYGPTAATTAATVANAVTQINASLPAGITAAANGNSVVFTDATGILASATIATGGVHTGTTVLPATAVPATTFTASLNGSDIMIADSSGGTTTASIALVAGTGTETFASLPATNNYQASVVGGKIQLQDNAGQPILGGAITAVANTAANPATAAGAETFVGAIAVNGAPVNRWSVSATIPNSGTTKAVIAAGDDIVQFNPDGTLNLAQSTFANASALSVSWDPAVTGGNSPQSLTFNLGSNGLSNGLTELGTTFSVGAINQDGVKFGNFTGVTVNSTGIVTANFNNGLHQAIYIVPIATVPNPDGLSPETGDTYGLTSAAGSMLLNQAGNGNTATITPSSLENSTVDIATEFTSLIITQNAYQANSKVITSANQMLQALLQIQA